MCSEYRTLEQFAVVRLVLRYDQLGAKLAPDAFGRGDTDSNPQVRIFEQRRCPRRHSLDIIRRAQIPGFAIIDDLGQAADASPKLSCSDGNRNTSVAERRSTNSCCSRTTKRRLSASTPQGWDRRAFVHLQATSCRCHRSKLSGVTIVATWRKACRPNRRDDPTSRSGL